MHRMNQLDTPGGPVSRRMRSGGGRGREGGRAYLDSHPARTGPARPQRLSYFSISFPSTNAEDNLSPHQNCPPRTHQPRPPARPTNDGNTYPRLNLNTHDIRNRVEATIQPLDSIGPGPTPSSNPAAKNSPLTYLPAHTRAAGTTSGPTCAATRGLTRPSRRAPARLDRTAATPPQGPRPCCSAWCWC